jgi:DNA adenine methylase
MPPQVTTNQFAIARSDFVQKRTDRVKPPFGYYGAKQRLASRIVATLPPHNAWVEAFCGSAAITLAKPEAPIEVINDKNGEIVNLFEQLRNNRDELCRAITFTPYAREEFYTARDGMSPATPLDRARRFLIATMMTVNGTVGNQTGFSFSSSYVRGGMEARVSRWNNLPKRLAEVAERLRHVRVENRDARELLEMFIDRPATLVYLDPPYFVKREYKYVIDANDAEFHKELLRLCQKAKCMILLSGYDTTLYNEMLPESKGWTRTVIETHTRDTSGKDYARSEVLWHNRSFEKAFRQGRVPIRLSKAEKIENKVNPERGVKRSSDDK